MSEHQKGMRRERISKSVFDILVASAGIVLLSPLFVVIAASIKLNSRGPILFRQERLGRAFKPFLIYKFRTMAAAQGPRGRLITVDDDARVTRIGRVLRKTKLDELPQLFNVLRRQMSIVGPRPEVRKYVDMFRDDYAALLAVRPGMTDPASVAFSDESRLLVSSPDPERVYVERILPEKIRLSLHYLQESSRSPLAADFRVIWRTAICLLGSRALVFAGAADALDRTDA